MRGRLITGPLGRRGALVGNRVAAPWDPLVTYKAFKVSDWDHAASRVTTLSGLVTQSNDRGPLARHLKLSTGVAPAYTTSEQDLNGQPCLAFANDATVRYLDTDAWTIEGQPESITVVAGGSPSGVSQWIFDSLTATISALYTATPTTWIQAAAGTFFDTTYDSSGTSAFKLANWPETHIYTAVLNNTSCALYVDGLLTAVAGAGGTNGRTGLRIGARGGASGTSGFRGNIGRIVRVGGYAMTQADVTRDHAALATLCLPEFWCVEGDSRTADDGSHVPVGNAWPTVMRATKALGYNVRIVNNAVGGSGASTVAARLTAAVQKYGTLRLRKTRFIQWIDINDIIVPPGTVTAANELIALKANQATMAAAGFTKSVIVAGCNYTGDTNQAALNALERADGTYPILSFDTANPIALIDGQHPTSAGQAVLAGLAAVHV